MGDEDSPVVYWKASGVLQDYVTGFHRFRVPHVPDGYQDAFLPSWATIRITLDEAAPWSVRIGNRVFEPVPVASFFGPTSLAGYALSRGGTLLGVGLKPFGWTQLFGGDVSRYANRVVSLESLDNGALALRHALADGGDVVTVFSQWLEARLQRRPPADPRIAQLTAMLEDPATTRIETMAEALEMAPRALAAMTRFNFGFTPKLLLRRTRFLRALSGILTRPEDSALLLEQAGYWDRSHFLRDSHLFLGCSVRDFLRRRGPLNQMALGAREKALGAAT